MQLYPESFFVLDTVTAATLALLGLIDREICDAAENSGKKSTNDFVGRCNRIKSGRTSCGGARDLFSFRC
jgi:hypothetical protein